MALAKSRLVLIQGPWNQKVSSLLSSVINKRQYSDDVKYLKSIDTAHLKRGRGGRSSFSGKVVTIFGSSGFVARYVANALGKHGTQMIFPYRCDGDDVRHLKVMGDLGQCLFLHYDLRDEQKIAQAVKYSDVVVNCLGSDRPTSNWSLHDANVVGAERLARISKEMGVEKFIHMSSLNCDRKHEGFFTPGGTDFYKTKFESEKVVRSVFPEAIIFRASDIYGGEDRFISYYCMWWRADKLKLPIAHKGIGVFKQPIWVGDIARAINNIVHKDAGEPGQTYQAVGPHRYEMADLMNWFLRMQCRQDPHLMPYYTTISDLRFSIKQRIKAMINPYFWKGSPRRATWDKLEREAVTDIVDPNLPTLVDLGVEPTTLESRAHWEFKVYRKDKDFQYDLSTIRPIEYAKYTVPE